MPRRRQTDGEKKIDISQMAEDLGVSKTTVSRALSGNGRVSEATRARVVQYAKEKNYVPNMLARGLVTQQSYNISLVFSRQFGNLAAPFLRKTVSAVYDIAARNDYDVLMTMVGEQETSPMQRLLVNRKIDGVILARTLERDPLIPMLQKSGIPFVAIGRPADQDVISVDHDQVGGCRELVSLLLMKGMRRIALLGGSMLYTVNQSRLEGYKQAHDRARCKIDESLLFLELESDDLRTSAVERAVLFSRQFGNLAAPFLRKTVSAVYDIAARNDYDVLMTMVGEQETSPMQRLLVNRKIDGVILARTLERDPLIPMLQKSGIPFVAIGRPADQDVISVDHDQVGGCRELVSLLLMKGMRRIALLGGSMLYTVNQSRLEGYKQAHDRARCKIDESLLFLELESDDLRTSAVERAVQRGADCILCMDDQVALLALSTLKQLNLRVPQDIRLASLYDDEALQECTPQITAVSFDAEQLGRRTAQQLLSLIRHQPVETRTLLGYQVGLRTSTQT